MIPKSSQLGAGGGKPEGTFTFFLAWGTLGSQHGAKTCPKRLLGLSWDGFGPVLDTFRKHFGCIFGSVLG